MKKNIRHAFLCALFFLIPNLLWGEKITDYTQLVSGQQYYIGATVSPTDYYFSAASENVGTGIQGSAVTDKTKATKVTAIGADDSWAFQLSNGNYLSLKDGKDNGKVAVVNAEAKWILSNTNSSLVNMTINGYCLQRNNNSSTSTNFGSYKSGQKDVWFELVPAEKPFTATLCANGAKYSVLTESKAGAGVELPTLTSLCDDWSFVGWSETDIAETTTRPTIIEAGTYKPTKDVTLYAVYSKSEDNGSGETQAVFDVKTIASENNWNNGTAYLSYTIAPITITYSGGGNNGKYYSSDNSWRIYTGGTITITSQSGTITKVTTTPTNTFTKQTNGSWVFNATQTVQFTKFTVSYSGGSTTTYASVPVCGTTQSSTISFDLNGGMGTALASVTGEVGKTITLPTAEGITKDGCTFAGWNTKADGTGTDYAAGTDFTVPASDATLYAKWQQTQQTPATITLSENGAETPFADGATFYVGSQITLPTTAGGNCNKSVSFVGWSEVEITNSATQPTTNFYAPGATYTIQQQNTKLYAVYAKTTLGVFRKVTTTPADWTGEYLIVYEAESVVFDGSISSGTSGKELDVAGNNQPVTINDNTIALADGQDYTFFIAKSGSEYTLQSKSGYYIGGAKNNGITCSPKDTYIHTLSLTATTNATIQTTYNSAQRYLRFNAASDQMRFRYISDKDAMKPVALYVKENGSCYDYSTTCSAAIDVAVPEFSVKEGTYSNAQSVEITCATSGAKIYYTTDGQEPTNASTLYTGAITVDKSMTIKAIAYADADNYSDVATATYSILQASDVKWQTYGDDGSSKVNLTEATIYTDGDLEMFIYTASAGKQTFTSTDENVAIVEMKNLYGLEYPALNVKGAGTTTITVNVAADDTYAAGSASFILHVEEHKQIVTMAFAQTSYTANLGETFAAPALTVTPTVTPIIYSSSNANVATVDAATGAITLLAMGVTTIKAEYAGDEVYDPASAQYTLHVVDPYADILTADKLTATNTTYKDFKDVQHVTGTLYAGYTAKDSEGSIQMNTKNKNSGIVSTSSMGFVKSITITFAKAGSINVYGNTSQYASATDLYETNGNNQGVKLGTLSGAAGETVSLTITDGNYPYIGIRSQSNAMYLKEIAISWTPAIVVRSGLTAGRYGTICLEHNATAMLGASFYEVAYREDNKVCFDEVTALEAGVPYIFLAEDEQITVVYGEETATVTGSKNGLVGTFVAIADGDAGAAGNVLEGNYLVNNNMIRLCGGNCNLPANRAYIRMNEVSTNVVAPAPGRRRITLQNADTQVSTSLNGISEDSSVAPQQEGIYDVLGRKLEQAAGTGFYIVNGKKQVVIK